MLAGAAAGFCTFLVAALLCIIFFSIGQGREDSTSDRDGAALDGAALDEAALDEAALDEAALDGEVLDEAEQVERDFNTSAEVNVTVDAYAPFPAVESLNMTQYAGEEGDEGMLVLTKCNKISVQY